MCQINFFYYFYPVIKNKKNSYEKKNFDSYGDCWRFCFNLLSRRRYNG